MAPTTAGRLAWCVALLEIFAAVPAFAAGDGCRYGFVWRETIPGDHVCVAPQSRAEARDDNAAAPGRVNRINHDYGPDTCEGGFVWREAFQGDHACVRPEVRERSRRENELAPTRLAEPGPRLATPPAPVVVVRPVVVAPGRVVIGEARPRRGEHRGDGEHREGGGHHGGSHPAGGHHESGGHPGGHHHKR